MEEKLTKVKDWSPEDRPREKLLTRGFQSLTNAELLAIIMGSGVPGLSVLDLAKKILADHENNLNVLGKATIKDLTNKYKGVGLVKAVTILTAMELGKRRQSETAKQSPFIKSSKDAFDLVHPIIGDLRHEEFWIILLNRANKVLGLHRTSIGSQTGTVVDIRQIVRLALEHHATGIILSHNHPSGMARPSHEDKTITRQIKEAAELFQITIFDHIIAAEDSYFSFADEGML